MTLDDILKLDNDLENLKVIDLYLKKNNNNLNSYRSVLLKRLDITFYSGKEKETIEQGFELIKTYDNDTNFKYKILSKLIEYATYIEREDLFLEILDLKRCVSSYTNIKFIQEDLYKFYLEVKNYEKAKNYLDKFLNESIEDNIKNEALINALLIAKVLKLKDYGKKNLEKLKEVHKRSFHLDNLVKGKIYYLELLKDLNLTNELEQEAINTLINDDLNKDEELKINTLLLNCYIKNNDLRKIENLIPEAEKLINDVSVDIKNEFLKETITFYNSINNKISVDYYKTLIEEREIKKEEKQKRRYKIEIPKKVFEKKEDKNEIEKIVKTKKVIEEVTGIKKINTNKEDLDLLQIIKKIVEENNYDNKRESVRKILEYSDNKLNFKSIIITKKIKDKFKILYYIKQRLYEKEVLKINGTLAEETFKEHKDLYLEKGNKEYLETYSLKKYEDEIEVVSIYLNKFTIAEIRLDNVDKHNIYTLKLSLYLLNLLIDTDIKEEKNKEEINTTNYINKRLQKGIKLLYNNKIYLDENLKQLLEEKDLYEVDYINKIKVTDRNKYLKILDKVKRDKDTIKSIIYTYKNKIVKETFIPYYNYKTYKIYSVVEEYENKYDELSILEENYYKDQNIYNLKKLEEDIKGFDVKTGYILIDFKNYNYFYELIDDLKIKEIKEKIIDTLKDYNKLNREIYYINEFKYLVVIKRNLDKRTVINETAIILERLNYELKLDKFIAAIYKQENKDNNNLRIILNNLNITLKKAKEINENILYFKREYKNEVIKKKELTTYINESLENNKVNIKFQEVINIKEEKIEGYKIIYSIDDDIYKEEEIINVIKQRGLYDKYIKHKIILVLNELKDLYDTFKGYLKCYIEIPSDLEFISFIEEELRIRKIPKSAIILLLDKAIESNLKIYSKNIIDHLDNPDIGYILDLYKVNKIKTNLKKDIFLKIKNTLAINIKQKNDFDDIKDINVNIGILSNGKSLKMDEIKLELAKQIKKLD